MTSCNGIKKREKTDERDSNDRIREEEEKETDEMGK